MNRKTLYGLVLTFWLALCVSARSGAQELPSLPRDSRIETGTLPDGIRYYIVTNNTRKGVADFALVRKAGYGDEDSLSAGKSLMYARRSMDSLSLFGSRKPESFLASYGISGHRGRHVVVNEDATVYRFENLSLSRGDAVIDSTLLMIFDIIGTTKCYPTESNAVIVSGDVDKGAILQKMRLMSLLVPKDTSGYERPQYRWEDTETPVCDVTVDRGRKYSTVTVSYAMPRTPEKYMNTVLSYVSDRIGGILEIIAKKRLYKELKNKDIPFGDIAVRHIGSGKASGDEKFIVSVTAETGDVSNVVAAISTVFAYLDSKGISEDEYRVAKNEYMRDVYIDANRMIVENSYYVDKCMASFLYSAGMSEPMHEYVFFAGAKMADSTLLKMFNSFSGNFLDRSRNLSIGCTVPDTVVTDREILDVYSSAWDREVAATDSRLFPVADESLLPNVPGDRKITVRRERKEHVSGGTFWQFSNGMNVVYRRMPTNGIFYYNLFVRGGFSKMDGLREGEGAFLSEVLETYDIAGLESDDFHYLMNACGVTMSSKVGVSEISLYGNATRNSLTSMMTALKAVANERSVNSKTYDYVSRCLGIWLESRKDRLGDRLEAIDTLMCPSCAYSTVKSVRNLSPDLPERAAIFFDSQFSRMNDGALVIVGDMEETAMKRFLMENLHGFRTSDTPSENVRLPYRPISGWSTYTKDGKANSVEVVMSAPLVSSTENFMAARAAGLLVKWAAMYAFAGTTTNVRVLYETMMYPQERFNMAISLTNGDPETYAAGAKELTSFEMLHIVRDVLSELADNAIDAAGLDVCRTALKNIVTSYQNDPQYIMEMAVMRFNFGKDLNTKVLEKIDRVTAEKIRTIISNLESGSRIEYLITEKE